MLPLQRMQAVLLPLLASFRIGHCHSQCPMECVSSFIVPTDRGMRVISGPAAKTVGKIVKDLSETRPSSLVDEITFGGEKIPVSPKVKSQMRSALNTFPELSPVFLDILRNRRPVASPGGKQRFPSFGSQEETLTPGGSQERPSAPNTSSFPDKVHPTGSRPDYHGFGFAAPSQRAPKNRDETPGLSNVFIPQPPNPETFRPSNDQPDDEVTGPLDSTHPAQKRPRPQSFWQPDERIPSDSNSSESQEFEPGSSNENFPRSKESEPFSSGVPKPSSPETSDQSSPEDSLPSGSQNDFHFSSERFKPESYSPEFDTSLGESDNSDSFNSEGSSEPFSTGDSKPIITNPNNFPSHPINIPHSKFPRPLSFPPSSQPGERPSSATDEPSAPEAKELTPEVNLPDLVKVARKDKQVPEDVRSHLKFLEDNPSLFVPIYKTLVNKGVKFPDLRRPIDHVTVEGKRINLPRPITVAFTIRINGNTFMLPRDADKLATFASRHPEQLPTITTIIRQFGGTLKPDNTGKVSSFTLFDKDTGLPQPVTPRVFVNGRSFTLPKDIEELMRTIEGRPELFHHVLPILETFGAHPRRAPSGEISSIEFRGRKFPVHSVAPVPVFIHGRRYNIPADLERILEQPDSQIVGELISALQRAKVPIVVDNDTGNVVGIERDGVRIPFPVAIRLGINMGGRNLLIPRDLPSIITLLERHGVPTDILNVLYNNYGIIPVRGPDHQVIAIEFNGKLYPIKPQPKISTEVGGYHLTLPRDSQKLVRLIQERKITVHQFLRTIQNAGYKLVPGPEGMVSTAHKGYDIIELPRRIRMLLTINGVRHRIPQDMPRIVELLRTTRNAAAIGKILHSLELLGVEVRKENGHVTLIFNGERHTFPLNTDSTAQSPSADVPPGSVVSVNINGRWYSLPRDANDLAAAVRTIGPKAIPLLVRTLQPSGIKVNLTPNGDDIVSFVIKGRVIPVSRNGGEFTARSEIPAGNVESGARNSSDRFPITIRGRQFVVPEDVDRLPRLVPGFRYGELITAIHRAGHRLEVDDQGMFYGMRVRGGRLVRFPISFSVSVFAEKKGRPFRVPNDLEKLARMLPLHRWDWKAMRKTLANAGIEMRGGNEGAPHSIGFQGRFFEIRDTHGGARD
ncbi:hypothetical protein HPB51_009483 [Rhipicephalus microplus]|uniref:Immunoglobulin G binding protein A n=1 Tax=Rhipicephalus microplus TaxID=6941 RepID=A0A9J6DTF7_RHIMP|nr:hypothetical protein HPB51_009483 [Rhipicephalus microplus]